MVFEVHRYDTCDVCCILTLIQNILGLSPARFLETKSKSFAKTPILDKVPDKLSCEITLKWHMPDCSISGNKVHIIHSQLRTWVVKKTWVILPGLPGFGFYFQNLCTRVKDQYVTNYMHFKVLPRDWPCSNNVFEDDYSKIKS